MHLFPRAKIVPLTVPPTGALVGEALADGGPDGPIDHLRRFDGFDALWPAIWVYADGGRFGGSVLGREVNDRAFIYLALALEAERLLAGAIENGNACGPGGAAAVTAVARRLGVERGVLLAHTDSNEVMRRRMGMTGSDAVGYAAIVF